MARPPKYNITDDDIDFLRKTYPIGDWGAIKKRFPNIPKSKIYHIVNDNKIAMNNYFWTEHDKNILIQHYNILPIKDIQAMLDKEYKIRTIQNKAKKLGLTESREWTIEEIDILFNHYEHMTCPEIKKMLPRKSIDAIYIKASQLGLKSGYVHKYYYTDEEIDIIYHNWEHMSDEEIGRLIGRDARSVMDQRHKLGLYYPKLETSYYDIVDYIRHNNQVWRRKSMEACQYKCILSGSKDIEVHHKYSFNMIVKEAMQDNRWIMKDIKEYTGEELMTLLSIFEEYQDKYPLGVCISKQIHQMFHSIYGNKLNTIEQWDEFVRFYSENKHQ